MDKNKIISARFLHFSKYLRNIAIICFVSFIIINAINTGNDILFWISYLLIMITIIGALQSVCLYAMGKYYASKNK